MALNEDGYDIEVITGQQKQAAHGNVNPCAGELNGMAALDNGKVFRLRTYRAEGWSHGDLAVMYGISVSRSSEICHGHAYKDAPGPIEPPGKRVYNRSVLSGGEDPAEVTARVLELHGDGLSQRVIAGIVNRSKTFVGYTIRGYQDAALSAHDEAA